MRTAIIVGVSGVLLILALWQGVEAQTVTGPGDAATARCWTVEHGPIGFRTMSSSSNFERGYGRNASGGGGTSRSTSVAPETWEAVLVNQCSGQTWRRRRYQDAWEPIGFFVGEASPSPEQMKHKRRGTGLKK